MTPKTYSHQARDGDIHGTGVFSFYRTLPRDHGFNPQWLNAIGLVAEGDIDYHGGLEISAFYTRQMYSIQKDGLVHTEVGKRMHIVLGYRHWFNSRFSLGGGFFSSYSMGGGRVVHSEFSSNQQPKTSASDLTDYGFDFSAQFEPIQMGHFAIVLDVRSSLPVTAKPGEDMAFWGGYIGLKFLAQERQPSDDSASVD
ncbi:MAG: hypothetical protein AB7F86_04595 [Bdellovibrionales bacterium]